MVILLSLTPFLFGITCCKPSAAISSNATTVGNGEDTTSRNVASHKHATSSCVSFGDDTALSATDCLHKTGSVDICSDKLTFVDIC